MDTICPTDLTLSTQHDWFSTSDPLNASSCDDLHGSDLLPISPLTSSQEADNEAFAQWTNDWQDQSTGDGIFVATECTATTPDVLNQSTVLQAPGPTNFDTDRYPLVNQRKVSLVEGESYEQSMEIHDLCTPPSSDEVDGDQVATGRVRDDLTVSGANDHRSPARSRLEVYPTPPCVEIDIGPSRWSDNHASERCGGDKDSLPEVAELLSIQSTSPPFPPSNLRSESTYDKSPAQKPFASSTPFETLSLKSAMHSPSVAEDPIWISSDNEDRTQKCVRGFCPIQRGRVTKRGAKKVANASVASLLEALHRATHDVEELLKQLHQVSADIQCPSTRSRETSEGIK
ncbi:MAG: hypothetical protein M1837_006403 [Sclerophora amabilis]|nr:MAG: hypothetical protein M1837_006403 [Sclerophora amabilis]